MGPKASPQEKAGAIGGGWAVFRGGEKFPKPPLAKPFYVDSSVQAVRDLFAVFVNAVQGIENCRHNCNGAKTRIVQHFVVKFFRAAAPMDGERHRNHLGLFAKYS